MLSASRHEREKLHRLTGELETLKSELARAWTTPDHRHSIGAIETQIRHVWNEIDSVSMDLGAPPKRSRTQCAV